MGFGRIDLWIVILYLGGVTLVGVYFRRQRDIQDYFLGGRNLSWWAICFSIVATETSTLTVIGTPAIAYGGTLAFLQLCLGYLVARFVISFLLLPQYFSGNLMTAYQYIEQRFGPTTRKMAAGLFLVTRALADAVRIWAIAIVVQLALPHITALFTRESTEVADLTAVLIVMGLTLLYTFLGGMKAVIWTDVVQFFLYFGGGIVAFWSLVHQIPGGLSTLVATSQYKLQPLDFQFSWTVPYTFWAGLLGGAFLTLASHGTDQLMVQRVLAARNLREGRRALITSGFIVFVQFALFLLIGVGLYAFDTQLFPDRAYESLDQVFPYFMVNHLPPVISGLMVAGVLAAAMSTSSSTLNSLAASSVVDFYQPLRPRQASPQELLKLSRWMTVIWGGVLVGLALLARHWGRVLEAGLAIASVTYGAMLGLFLLGRLVPSATPRGAGAGMAAGLALLLYVKFYTPIAWTWYVLIGTGATFLVGWSLSRILPNGKYDER